MNMRVRFDAILGRSFSEVRLNTTGRTELDFINFVIKFLIDMNTFGFS